MGFLFMDHTGINPWDIHDFPRDVDPIYGCHFSVAARLRKRYRIMMGIMIYHV